MDSEGRGHVAPKRIKVFIPSGDARLFADLARERAKKRGYTRRDGWSAGLADGIRYEAYGYFSRAERPIFVGLMGEWAVSLRLSAMTGRVIPMDVEDRPNGDLGIDLSASGLPLQVKTRQGESNISLVRFEKSLSAEVFVFCQFTGTRYVSILGWCWRKDVLALSLRPARVGTHRNFEIEDCDLLPMSRLKFVLHQGSTRS